MAEKQQYNNPPYQGDVYQIDISKFPPNRKDKRKEPDTPIEPREKYDFSSDDENNESGFSSPLTQELSQRTDTSSGYSSNNEKSGTSSPIILTQATEKTYKSETSSGFSSPVYNNEISSISSNPTSELGSELGSESDSDLESDTSILTTPNNKPTREEQIIKMTQKKNNPVSTESDNAKGLYTDEVSKEYTNEPLDYDDLILDNFNNLLDLLFSLVTESNREYLQFSLICDHFNYICEKSCEYNPTEYKGGSSFCEGTLDEYNDQLAYGTLGCAKLLPELTHDFHPFFSKSLMDLLKKNYIDFIKYIQNINQQKSETSESSDYHIVSKFVDSLLANNHEWNYSTKVLEFMDNECNKLDDLTIVKVLKESDYPLSPTEYSDNYRKTLHNTKYFYMAIDNTPVEKIFDLSDVNTRVQDNGTADKKLYPLIYDGPIASDDELNSFKNSIYNVTNGPGMLDPSTTHPVDISNFTSNNPQFVDVEGAMADTEHIEALKRIQNAQDINGADESNTMIKNIMKAGLT
jgi:hypothetical protein